MNKIQTCFKCNSNKYTKHLFTTTDVYRKVSNDKFDYLKCNKCKHIFIKSIPKNLTKFYGKNYYNFPSIKKLKKIALNEKFKFDMVKNYFCKGDRICEIGPSIGVFLYNAKSYGLNCTGIEMSKECCKFISEKLKIKTLNSNIPQVALKKIKQQDAIFFWHSLEHMQNPDKVLDACIGKLKSDGLIVIACPNPDSFGFKLTGKNWPHLDAPRHLNLFSINSLEAYMKNKNLKNIFKTTSDLSSKYYNTFSWQLYLFNLFNNNKIFDFHNKNLHYFFWKLVGKLFSIIFFPFENRRLKGSCYTLIFQKK